MNLPPVITLRPPEPRSVRRARQARAARRRRAVIAGAVAALLALLGGGAVLIGHRGRGDSGTSSQSDRAAVSSSRAFLAGYVDPDGRVVRRDQGGDTVSEGQAYAMLAAVTAGDKAELARVWSWTRAHLQRPDGLLSWHWQSGRVSDTSSATDADLDTAWALSMAARRFSDDTLAQQSKDLAAAILTHETVSTEIGPVITAGSWVREAPAVINPSYFSPAAYAELADRTGDARWSAVATTSRTILDRLTAGGHLPPDWARIVHSGQVSPSAGPGGAVSGGSSGGRYPVFGQDAARVPVRYASSCLAADRALAARSATLLTATPPERRSAVYDLAGSPQVNYDVPVERVAASAAALAAGNSAAQQSALAGAADLAQRSSTYYGAAWVALGRALLTTDLLVSCPTTEGR